MGDELTSTSFDSVEVSRWSWYQDWRGSWRLLLPLARGLARHFEVITYGLRGDHSRGRSEPRHVDEYGILVNMRTT